MSDLLLDDLTDTQRDAVTSTDPRVLAVAVAGSGKTRVLTRRIVRLLRDGVPPDRILAVTFTRDAAQVMQERVSDLLIEHGMGHLDPPEIRTFHSWGFKLVQAFARDLGMWSEVTVYDQVDLQAVADSWAGRKIRGLERRMAADGHMRREIEARVMRAGAVTFSMIERMALDILAGKYPGLNLRDSAWGRFDHVLVDEYQDVNLAQALVVENLAPPNLFVTGDSEQAIYGFRGAQPQRLRDLLEAEGWQVFELDRTFRHGGAVLDLANLVRPDDLVARSAREGGELGVVHGPTPAHCCRSAVALAIGNGYAPQDIAILARTWRELAAVEAAVAEAAPTFLAAPDEDPWNQPGPRLVSVALRLARNRFDNELALRLAAVLLPGLDLQQELWSALEARQALSVWLQGREGWPDLSQGALPTARAVVEALRVRLPEEHVAWCLDFISERNMDLDGFHRWWMERGMAIRWRRDRAGDAVYLGTVHAAKGQEWPVVVIPDARDGVYPPRKRARETEAEHARGVEEARRVLYVAVTRARERVVICRAQAAPAYRGELEWCSPSPWLSGVPL